MLTRTLVLSLALAVPLRCAAMQQEPARSIPATPLVAPGQAGAEKQPEKAPVYNEAADGAAQIAAALAHAKRENRRVLIQWGANWCGWCILLHGQSQTDQELRRKLMYEYDVVHIDVGRFDKHMDLAEEYGADLRGNGIPFWTVLDADGEVLANQETGSLENEAGSEKSHNTERVVAFLAEHQAQYRSASAILDEGLARARSEGKTAFVHFGAPWCGWCHRLERFMARPDVAPVLERHFVDIKIDTDRTIGGGEALLELRGGQRGGIPWFTFLDADGEELTNSTGEKGNIGFPVQPHEIGHFMSMLERVRPPFAPEELRAIEDALENDPSKHD